MPAIPEPTLILLDFGRRRLSWQFYSASLGKRGLTKGIQKEDNCIEGQNELVVPYWPSVSPPPTLGLLFSCHKQFESYDIRYRIDGPCSQFVLIEIWGESAKKIIQDQNRQEGCHHSREDFQIDGFKLRDNQAANADP